MTVKFHFSKDFGNPKTNYVRAMHEISAITKEEFVITKFEDSPSCGLLLQSDPQGQLLDSETSCR